MNTDFTDYTNHSIHKPPALPVVADFNDKYLLSAYVCVGLRLKFGFYQSHIIYIDCSWFRQADGEYSEPLNLI